MTSEATNRRWWLISAVVALLAALSNVAVVAFVGGGARTLVWTLLWVVMAVVSFARYRGWKGSLFK